MNFFCSSAEFDQYVTDMELDAASVIKADMDRAVEVAYLLESEHAREILETMIIPQLEEDRAQRWQA